MRGFPPGATIALPWVLLTFLFALHHDFWLWDAPHRVAWAAGLPAGFLYHVGYCLAAAAAMALLARRAWPPGLDEDGP